MDIANYLSVRYCISEIPVVDSFYSFPYVAPSLNLVL